MRKTLLSIAVAAFSMFGATGAYAGGWTLNPEGSKIAFGSVKKDSVGESHHFERLSGAVSEAGDVEVTIDLTSVQTWIDIRNERMLELVFLDAKTAVLKATVDVQALESLAVGGMQTIAIKGTLSFLGQELPVETDMFAARLSDEKVMITTDEMIWLKAEEAGLTPGVDKLMEIAELPSITRAIPVTARFIFESGDVGSQGAADSETEVTAAAFTGDPDKGKRVYKKCKACHKLEAGKNSVGPSLAGIIGQPAGAVEGFKYSKAMAESGLVWDEETLRAFLEKPKAVVPKTKMTFVGLKKEKDIDNLLAYLASESQ